MRLTERDVRLVKDIALSSVLSRDQVMNLGYFESISRANRRLKSLIDERILKGLDIPFHAQRLYVPGPKADSVVGERIASLISHRQETPRFLQHAMAVTGVRIALLRRGYSVWRFEAQIRDSVRIGNTIYEIRPDGLVLGKDGPVLIEVDLGNVSQKNFAKKMTAFEMYVSSGRQKEAFKTEQLNLLVVSTGDLRLKHLRETSKPMTGLATKFVTFAELNLSVPGVWS